MKKLRDTNLGRYLIAISATVHPVRAVFEVCGTLLFAAPFLAAFIMTRSAPLYLYLLYPLLFLVSHFVWFRLPDGLTAEQLLEEHRVAVAPGEGFGPSGAGWARLSVAVDDEAIALGVERLQHAFAGLAVR